MASKGGKSSGSKSAGSGHARSAKTGQYVTMEYAKKHPATTVTEHGGGLRGGKKK